MRGVWVFMNQEKSARVQLFAVTAREEEDQVDTISPSAHIQDIALDAT